MTTWKPCGVSCISTINSSPEFMNRSRLGSGVNVASVEFTGLGGPPGCGLPFRVMNAKLTYSTPTRPAQVEFWAVPAFGSSDRLSMLSAAHQWYASQLLPGGHSTQPRG